jgi:hypothetical protein
MMLETLHNKVRRLGDAIFCLQDANIHPEMVEVLQGEMSEAHAEYKRLQAAIVPAKTKTPIPNDIRWAVFERDNFTCQNCGSRRLLEADHVYPESKGGKTVPENLQTLCQTCNRKKGAR